MLAPWSRLPDSCTVSKEGHLDTAWAMVTPVTAVLQATAGVIYWRYPGSRETGCRLEVRRLTQHSFHLYVGSHNNLQSQYLDNITHHL